MIETQPADFVKKPQKYMGIVKLFLGKFPNMVKVMRDRHLMYNEEKAYVRQKEQAGEVFVIRPSVAPNINPTEKNPDELQRVYEMGRAEAIRSLEGLKQYLA